MSLLAAPGWVVIPPPSGALLNGITVDPRTPSNVYLYTAQGLFRSTDGARSWKNTGFGAPPDEDPLAGVSAVTVNPLQCRIAYACGRYLHVARSDDWGATWRDLAPMGAYAVAVDPQRPDTIYAAGEDFLLRSDDGGATWHRRQRGLGNWPVANCLSVASADPTMVLLGSYYGLFRSLNGGRDWSKCDLPGVVDQQATAVAVDPSDSRVVLAVMLATRRSESRLFRSADRGEHWHVVSDEARHGKIFAVCFGAPGTGVAYAGGERAELISRDAGLTWTPAAGMPPGLPVWSVATPPADNRVIYAATSDFVAVSKDGGAHWVARTEGMPPVPFNAFAPDPVFAGSLYATTEGSFCFSEDDGATWRRIGHGLPAHAWVLTLHPRDRSTIFAETWDGLYASTDRGRTWRSLFTDAFRPAEGGWIVAVDPEDSKTLAVVDTGAAYITHDRGASWTKTGGGVTYPTANLILFDPHKRGRLLAMTYDAIYCSTDWGADWQLLDAPAPDEIAFSPDVPGLLLLADRERGLYRSRDGGISFTPTGLLVTGLTSIAFDPRNPDRVFAGMDEGLVYVSHDRGETWRAVPGRPLDASIYALWCTAGSTASGSLYAASGEAIYQLDLTVECE